MVGTFNEDGGVGRVDGTGVVGKVEGVTGVVGKVEGRVGVDRGV